MNLLEVIDHVSHLKLIIHFNQFSESENKIIEKYRHKIAIVHFETLLVN